MFTKESVEKKWSDYAQAAQQEGKVSALPTFLKTTGVLAGVAIVPCLSAGTAQAAIITGTNFTVNGSTGVTGAPVVGNGDDFGAFNGQVAWYLVSNSTANPSAPASAVIMSYNSSFPAYVLNNAGYAMVMANGAAISSGAGSFSDYRAVPDSGNGYLGIRFELIKDSGDFRYGWIEVSLTGGGDVELIKWGYNDVVGASIEAGQIPEPTSLALLACGAAGLVARRRKRKVSA